MEQKSFQSEELREKYDSLRLEKVGKEADSSESFDKNQDIRQKKRLRKPVDLGKLVYVLAERVKKNDAPGRLLKSSIENQSFFKKKHKSNQKDLLLLAVRDGRSKYY